MLLSQLIGRRYKEAPGDAMLVSHALLLRGGYIRQVANGIKSYEDGMEEDWVRIHLVADKFNTIDRALFDREFKDYRSELRERQIYIANENNTAIGTATAWSSDDEDKKDYGIVHWVAVDPSYQGQGLGKVLVSTVCQILLQMGYNKAMLMTDKERPVAINLYKKFGFIEVAGCK